MSSEEKTEEASAHKLREARRRGEVAISRELTSAFSFAVALGVLWADWDHLQQRLRSLFSAALALAASRDPARDTAAAVQQMMLDLLWIVAPVLLAAVAAALLAGMLQTRGVMSAHPLKIDLSRMSPGQMLQRMFSTRQLAEVARVALVLLLLGGVLLAVLKHQVGPLVQRVYAPAERAGAAAGRGLGDLFLWAAAVFLALGVLDYALQWFEYRKRNRMSKSERKREHRDHEGDPLLRGELRRQRRELVERGGSPGLAQAKVVVTNPTHFAVALYYEAGVVDLPVVVAKGEDAAALQIRQQAQQLAIPLLESPPLARSLYRAVDLGDCIGDEHVDAVAEVFRWLADLGRDRAGPVPQERAR